MDFSMSAPRSSFAVAENGKAPLLRNKTRATYAFDFTAVSQTHRHHDVFVIIVAAFGRTQLRL